ncbi:MAG TPA: co-chaperone GroES [Thalassobaculum sp.]
MKFRPLHDRVVVEPIEAETKTAGGIIIPDNAKEKPSQGKIIAAGPGSRDDSGKIQKLDVKAGDTVLYGKWSGTEVKLDGKTVMIMRESDIMGIVG